MMDELKACPFCGSSNTTLDYYEISCPQELGTIVVCNDCGASAKSIVDWNTRPIEDALNARIAELEAERRWIPVSERLPEDGEVVWLWDGNNLGMGYYLVLSGCFMDRDTPLRRIKPTHWMPLPESPIVYGKACIDQLTAHDATERQDDKSPNDTQTQTIVYGKEREE